MRSYRKVSAALEMILVWKDWLLSVYFLSQRFFQEPVPGRDVTRLSASITISTPEFSSYSTHQPPQGFKAVHSHWALWLSKNNRQWQCSKVPLYCVFAGLWLFCDFSVTRLSMWCDSALSVVVRSSLCCCKQLSLWLYAALSVVVSSFLFSCTELTMRLYAVVNVVFKTN